MDKGVVYSPVITVHFTHKKGKEMSAPKASKFIGVFMLMLVVLFVLYVLNSVFESANDKKSVGVENSQIPGVSGALPSFPK